LVPERIRNRRFEKMKATSQGEEIESERGTGAERVDAVRR